MERHQDSIAELRNLLNTRVCNDASCYKCGKVGHIASNCSDNLWCSVCLKTGHMTRDCKGGDGCCKCSSVGHLGKDCPDDWCFGGGGLLCYYCGMWGYMAVCSLCGERGHLGKDCWCPDRVASVNFLQKKFKSPDLQGKALNWLKKYPCCF
nr:zinc finger protein GIS2 [Tanacetum cinerariifolium]